MRGSILGREIPRSFSIRLSITMSKSAQHTGNNIVLAAGGKT